LQEFLAIYAFLQKKTADLQQFHLDGGAACTLYDNRTACGQGGSHRAGIQIGEAFGLSQRQIGCHSGRLAGLVHIDHNTDASESLVHCVPAMRHA
jgi:hypothetical protein